MRASWEMGAAARSAAARSAEGDGVDRRRGREAGEGDGDGEVRAECGRSRMGCRARSDRVGIKTNLSPCVLDIPRSASPLLFSSYPLCSLLTRTGSVRPAAGYGMRCPPPSPPTADVDQARCRASRRRDTAVERPVRALLVFVALVLIGLARSGVGLDGCCAI